MSSPAEPYTSEGGTPRVGRTERKGYKVYFSNWAKNLILLKEKCATELQTLPENWPDQSIQGRLSLLIRPNSITCVDIHILLRNTYRVFQHSVKPVRPKNDSADSTEPYRRLLLLPKHLPVGLPIGIKAITLTLFPSGFQLRRSNVPVRTAFLQHSTQVLP